MNFLAIGAHPDDIDFTAGGTVAKLTQSQNNNTVHYCLVTNGQAGGQESSRPRSSHAQQRRAEQEASAKLLGVASSTHLDLADGLLEPTIDLRRSLTKVIRTVKPDIVIAPSPRYNFANIHFLHPDHMAVGAATTAAVYPDSRNQFAFPELGLEPHSVKQIWLVEDTEPDMFIDITETFETKFEALSQHSSQFATTTGLREAMNRSATENAQMADTKLDKAEAFKCIIYEECELNI